MITAGNRGFILKGEIMIDFTCEEQASIVPSIKVIGVGGAGGNTVNSLIESGCQRIHCIAANTDAQALEQSHAQKKFNSVSKQQKGLAPALTLKWANMQRKKILIKLWSHRRCRYCFFDCRHGWRNRFWCITCHCTCIKRRRDIDNCNRHNTFYI